MEYFRSEANWRDGLGLNIKGVTSEAMAVLEGDDWPGNVRELEAVVKRAMVCRRAGWVAPDEHRLVHEAYRREMLSVRCPTIFMAVDHGTPARSTFRTAVRRKS